jgi:hypothetical protein
MRTDCHDIINKWKNSVTIKLLKGIKLVSLNEFNWSNIMKIGNIVEYLGCPVCDCVSIKLHDTRATYNATPRKCPRCWGILEVREMNATDAINA